VKFVSRGCARETVRRGLDFELRLKIYLAAGGVAEATNRVHLAQAGKRGRQN